MDKAATFMPHRAGFRTVAVYVPQGASTFDLGMTTEVFSDRSECGLPAFDLAMGSDTPGRVRTDFGLSVHVAHGLDTLMRADLVILLPGSGREFVPRPRLLEAIRAAHRAGAIIVGHCVGAFTLAATGLLDGRRATTHWRSAEQLAQRFPAVIVTPDALYVDEGDVLTGAGAASGLDLFLHIVRREHGSGAANALARDIVTAPHRDGGHAQYLEMPVPVHGDDERIARVITFAMSHTGPSLTVDDLARRALMSPRTFNRRFKAATGTTPYSWLLSRRLSHVEQLLETTDLSIEDIARSVGYASATVLREQFHKRRGVSPRVYRRTFGARLKQESAG